MVTSNACPYFESRNVLVDSDLSVPEHQLGHIPTAGQRITRKTIEDLVVENYRSGGKGITFEDVQNRFFLRKAKVQRSLKHFHMKGILFTALDLNRQGISLHNTNPQQYFPSSIKADIIEDLKRRSANVLVQPTGSNLIGSTLTRSNLPNHGNALSNVLDHQKAQSFLDVLILLPFTPLHIHKPQLTLFIDREYYQSLANKAEPINQAKRFEEIIGRRYVIYIFYPNVLVASVRRIPSLSIIFYLNLKGPETMGDITMISNKNYLIDILSECKYNNHNACHEEWLGFEFQGVCRSQCSHRGKRQLKNGQTSGLN